MQLYKNGEHIYIQLPLAQEKRIGGWFEYEGSTNQPNQLSRFFLTAKANIRDHTH